MMKTALPYHHATRSLRPNCVSHPRQILPRVIKSVLTSTLTLALLTTLTCSLTWAHASSAQAADAPAPNSPINQNDVYTVPNKAPAWVPGYKVRYTIRAAGDLETSKAKSIITQIPAGGWLKADGSDIIAQSADGKTIPVRVLSHDAQGNTLVQFARNGKDRFYWIYAVNPNAKPVKAPEFEEGLTYGIRQWQGDDLTSWAKVRQGFMKSSNVIGNGMAVQLLQTTNPARPGDARNFAAAYRGYINIPMDGKYRFFANAEDAVFCFIDGMIVDQRAGLGPYRTGKVTLDSMGNLVDMKAGVHRIELYHVMGTKASSRGTAALIWVLPGKKKFQFVPASAFIQALASSIVDIARQKPDQQIALINQGIEDVLLAGQTELYLVRLEASGHITDPSKLIWDFGDGTTGKGRTVHHVYFKQGSFKITLKSSDDLPAITQRLNVWPIYGQTSPLTPGRVVESFEKSDWRSYSYVRQQQIYEFLINCEQPNRWPLVEKLTKVLMEHPANDLRMRTTQYAMLIEALAREGKADEASATLAKGLKEVGKITSLTSDLNLAAARVYERILHQPDTAANIYQDIIQKHGRLRDTATRDAAVALGDLYLSSGNTPQAAKSYRLAQSLNSDVGESAASAATRGALLRTAELELRKGSVRQSRRILDKVAVDYPQQKLEGLYRFLRAEADRVGGRYEEAIYSYQVLLKLDQWAGYRNKALFGIADSYQRMGELNESIRWLDAIKSSFPDYYKKEKLDAYRDNILDRQKRIESDKNFKAFTSLAVHFDPNAPKDRAKWGTFDNKRFGIISEPAIAGNGAMLLDFLGPTTGYWDYYQNLPNINTQDYYWVEFWYRNTLEPMRMLVNQHCNAWLTDTNNQSSSESQGIVYLDVTYGGNWHHVGYLLRPPLTQDGKLHLSYRLAQGMVEISGLKITAVSDRTYDAFQNFVDGTPEQ